MTEGMRGSALAAKVGGFLWVVHYGLHLGFGLKTGRVLFEAGDTLTGRIDRLAFFGAYLMLGLALLGLSRSLRGRTAGWGYVGLFFSIMAVMAGVAGAGLALPGADGEAVGMIAPLAGKVGIFGLFLGAIFTGNGLLRAGWVPRWVALAVLFFGWLTFPAAMLVMPFEAVVPPYVVMELHFLAVGVLWMLIGSSLSTAGRVVADGRTGRTAAQPPVLHRRRVASEPAAPS